MSEPFKNSTKVVTIEITDELAARHHDAAEQIIDIIFAACDGPGDALYLLKRICLSLMKHYGIRDVVDEMQMPTEKIQ